MHFNHLNKADEHALRELVANHLRYTGSPRAKQILDEWEAYLPRFIKVMPIEYRRALHEIAVAKGLTPAAAKPEHVQSLGGGFRPAPAKVETA